jgi:hypothetical protein
VKREKAPFGEKGREIKERIRQKKKKRRNKNEKKLKDEWENSRFTLK